jgi:Z1 domain
MLDKITLPAPVGALDVTGECFRSVVKHLTAATTQDSATMTRRRAVDVVMSCVKSYQRAFGGNDVGAGGTGRVSNRYAGIAPGTNGLMYGRVQSGKTNASITSVALANANGFKCFVVLTSDNIWLGKQTVDRFRDQLGAGGGPIVRGWEDWREDPQLFANAISPYVSDVGVVLVTTKNAKNLESLSQVLRLIDASAVPGLILDDEADNASLNTNAAKMAKGKASDPSKIFALIGDLRETMPNHVFVQITATPQSLLLQGLEHPSRPSWVVMIDPGELYVGGDRFFGPDKSALVHVDGDELGLLKSGKVAPGSTWEMPPGLARAVCCFAVGAAVRQIQTEITEVISMLIHVDHKKVTHKAIKEVLNTFILGLDQGLRGKSSISDRKKAEAHIQRAWDELAKTFTDMPPIEAVLGKLKSNLRNADPQIIDADNPNQKPDFRRGMNFLIGGNRLGRGVTIDGLTVTYYGRDAKTKMMDTVHQHARMFGYREALLPITRLYSPEHIIESLTDIHHADEGTRQLLLKNGKLAVKPVWVGPDLKPTRANVLNPAELRAVVGDRTIFPRKIVHDKANLERLMPPLEKRLSEFREPDEYYDIPIDSMLEILRLIPSDPHPSATWSDERVGQILMAMKSRPIEIHDGKINVRRGRGKSEDGFDADRRKAEEGLRSHGYAEGTQISDAKSKFPKQPILLLRKQKGDRSKGWLGHPLYAPTLIVPEIGFVFVFVN